jgi:toxin FitB
MKILDTNILIYSGESQYANLLLPYVTDSENTISAISKVETLGFSRITPSQITFFKNVFKIVISQSVTEQIIEKSIELRQQRKMSLGDAIIAATALDLDVILVTRNTSDFDWINGIQLENPFI